MKSEIIVIYPQVKLVIHYDPKDLEGKGTGDCKVIVLPRRFEWML